MLSFSTRSSAQNTIEEVAKDVCAELCKVDLANTSTPAIARAMEVVKALVPHIEHGAVIDNYKKKYPDAAKLPQAQLEDRMITDIACLLMRDCPAFIAIAMNNGKKMPEVSKATAKIGDRFTTLLGEKLKSAPMSQNLVNECTAKVMEENINELTKTYGADYATAFPNDFRSYLLTRCEPYKRWTIGNMIKQFRMLQNFGM
jgi:hypothetical protein